MYLCLCESVSICVLFIYRHTCMHAYKIHAYIYTHLFKEKEATNLREFMYILHMSAVPPEVRKCCQIASIEVHWCQELNFGPLTEQCMSLAIESSVSQLLVLKCEGKGKIAILLQNILIKQNSIFSFVTDPWYSKC